MRDDRLLLSLVGLIYVLLALHLVAQHFFLYWLYWWYDIVMHFLGGVWLGLAIIWLVYQSGYVRSVWQARSRLLLVLLGIFVLGGLWESFEYVNHLIFNLEFRGGYIEDTVLDLVLDLAGGLAAVWLSGALVNTKIQPGSSEGGGLDVPV